MTRAHHRQMYAAHREAVRTACLEGRARVVVTTSALAMGVNLPATHVAVRVWGCRQSASSKKPESLISRGCSSWGGMAWRGSASAKASRSGFRSTCDGAPSKIRRSSVRSSQFGRRGNHHRYRLRLHPPTAELQRSWCATGRSSVSTGASLARDRNTRNYHHDNVDNARKMCLTSRAGGF